jgi:hypothetical protein
MFNQHAVVGRSDDRQAVTILQRSVTFPDLDRIADLTVAIYDVNIRHNTGAIRDAATSTFNPGDGNTSTKP